MLENFFSMKFIYLIHKTPLFLAVEKGDTEIVQLLLSFQGIDVNIFSI